MKETLEFLRDLAANNNRQWFNANKDRYLRVKAACESLAERLILGLSEIEPAASYMQPSDCMYRIYRDTRFSPDKTPYKTHIGIYINPFGGKKSQFGGYYLHLEADNVHLAGGIWCPDPKVLRAVRQSVYDNVEEYLDIIENAEFKKQFTEIGAELLKTAPKGFPKDWEYIALLKPRSYTASGRLLSENFSADEILSESLRAFALLKPYNDFLNYIFEEHPDLPHFYE